MFLARRSTLVIGLALGAALVAPGIAGATSPGTATSLQNGTFTTPALASGAYTITNQANVPGWSTTEADGAIEIWNGTQGIVAPHGGQSAELNANTVGAIYQDIATTPGTTYDWTVSHTARCAGTDVANVEIGPSGGSLTTVQVMSDSKGTWGSYSGAYVVPAGQTETRFLLQSVSQGCGNNSEGNEVANVSFAPVPDVGAPAGGPLGIVGLSAAAGIGLVALGFMSRRRAPLRRSL